MPRLVSTRCSAHRADICRTPFRGRLYAAITCTVVRTGWGPGSDPRPVPLTMDRRLSAVQSGVFAGRRAPPMARLWGQWAPPSARGSVRDDGTRRRLDFAWVGLEGQDEVESSAGAEECAVVVGSVLEGLVDADGVVAGQQGLAEVGEGSEPDGGLADGDQPAAAQPPLDRPARMSGRPDPVPGAPTECGGGEPGGALGRREQGSPSWVEQAGEVEAVERGDQDVAVWSGDPGHLADCGVGFRKPGQHPQGKHEIEAPGGEAEPLGVAEDGRDQLANTRGHGMVLGALEHCRAAVEGSDQVAAAGQLDRGRTGAAADLQDPQSPRVRPRQLLDPGQGDLLAAAQDPGLQRRLRIDPIPPGGSLLELPGGPRLPGWPQGAWTADAAPAAWRLVARHCGAPRHPCCVLPRPRAPGRRRRPPAVSAPPA